MSDQLVHRTSLRANFLCFLLRNFGLIPILIFGNALERLRHVPDAFDLHQKRLVQLGMVLVHTKIDAGLAEE